VRLAARAFVNARKAIHLLAANPPSLANATLRVSLMMSLQAFGFAQAQGCDKPVYLTFDTGHMGVAPLIAEVLKKQDVRATFFLANEPTQPRSAGGTSLDAHWAPWWKARAAEGHAFGSHTWGHWVWQRDTAGGKFIVKATAGAQAGQTFEVDATQYCAELNKVRDYFSSATGMELLPVFRAPAGRVSPNLLAAARSCGYSHVGWSRAGFLGDELPSERYPNALLLKKALDDIRPGDVLMAHLGIWSRQDPWAPAVLEPLIAGLKQRGFCFRTLREHPEYPQFAQAGKRWGGY
jgi:peptidoglycan/xylan/chitin deacetylase (PgdA/CDA1 family)